MPHTTGDALDSTWPGPGVQMRAQGSAGFRVQLTHGPSESQLGTEAPKDNGGTGSSFSPTDLVGAALASCALTTMALVAAREGIALGEAGASVEKRMTPAPRRIGALLVEFQMPAGLSPGERARMEETARGCPVARSLGSEVEHPMRFVYPD